MRPTEGRKLSELTFPRQKDYGNFNGFFEVTYDRSSPVRGTIDQSKPYRGGKQSADSMTKPFVERKISNSRGKEEEFLNEANQRDFNKVEKMFSDWNQSQS